MKGYQLKITIKGSSPPIWRRVLVPEAITFQNLDEIIEYIFGWTHSHLYDFWIPREEVRISEWGDCGELEASEECIDSWFYEKAKMIYMYDFGDSWRHEIVVEKIVEYSERFPVVLKSKGPNMIEDCGGIWGFYDYIDEAEPFELDRVNDHMKKYMVFSYYEQKIIDLEEYTYEKEEERKIEKAQEKLFEVMDTIESEVDYMVSLMMETVKNVEKDLTIKQVLESYTKEELVSLAKKNQFSGYSRLKKGELVDWIYARMVDDTYMESLIKQASQQEIEFFESLLEEPRLLLEEAPDGLLLQYVVRFVDISFITNDIKEKYRKICGSNAFKKFKKERDKKWKEI